MYNVQFSMYIPNYSFDSENDRWLHVWPKVAEDMHAEDKTSQECEADITDITIFNIFFVVLGFITGSAMGSIMESVMGLVMSLSQGSQVSKVNLIFPHIFAKSAGEGFSTHTALVIFGGFQPLHNFWYYHPIIS